ncbi:uncharacterized protein LOC131016195 [Salvia miltiorrhiza]|uniref:uncharacterized protein LOC131016195 n=1 Tax=Salvia miltiorrhiza TaxID=226208 RepID=UPI0025AC1744|nr:uncharacterized protein LOC131016195 [Salvia miltiorrhiza]XP_057800812.1 uncharacterized protein LOC131016195 [Salvia miltiorrhiza]XP_057800813.1 uncharacterized protein LOC131016195 [Salvia miltiorrhiza]
MSFQKVYESLQDLFPLIDDRALRAVAIEHSKDVDAAVVAVLEEIIPFFTVRSTPNSPLGRSVCEGESSKGSSSVRTEVVPQEENDHRFVSGNSQPSTSADDGLSEPFRDAIAGHSESEDDTAQLTLSVETHDDGIKMNADIHSQSESLVVIGEDRVGTCQIEVSGGPQTESTVSADKYLENSSETSCGSSSQITVGMSQDVEMDVVQKMDCIPENENDADGTAHDLSASSSWVEAPDMLGSNLDKSNLSFSTDITSSGKNMSDTIGIEEESTLNASVSSQIGNMDVLEEIIADARNNKKTLFLEMESVINLMKQVEVKEQDAEQAKIEAARGGMDLLNQVEELKRMLQHAKEANDMHAGEVYGEKAILATELRELQSRLHFLSDDRDKSLADLDEMRQCLEVRLAAAVNEIKSAELKKLEKEEVARKFLVEQELIMEQVVQESKILRLQAEDNCKLHEFLVDRGRVVDTLQGEIAVICQDVKHLKEKFDQHLPLGKSLFSNQTSFLLASSTSSLKSLVPDQVETVTVRDDERLETENNRNHEKVPEEDEAAREDCNAPENNSDHEKVPEVEAAREDSKVLIEDDGWEFFDSSEANS